MLRTAARSVAALVAGAVVASTAASAKEIPNGALLVCGAKRCVTVTDPAATRAFNRLLWGPGQVARAPTPRVGSPIYALRYRNGPAGAIINHTAIRVHGLNCGRFRRGRWYRLPPALRGWAAGLAPKRLRAHVPPSC